MHQGVVWWDIEDPTCQIENLAYKMNPKNVQLANEIVNCSYIQCGIQAIQTRQNLLSHLLAHRRAPDNGWDDATIQYMLHELAAMDSNNFIANVGVGEREARIKCSLVYIQVYMYIYKV